MAKKIIIVGGVAGGASAAARLRRNDEASEIIVMEKGGYISFANCGLPYYIGDVIQNRDALLLQSPQLMKERFNIDVRIHNEVISINRDKQEVSVIKDGKQYQESYDELILATGSSPILPTIPGIESKGIYTLWNMDDVDTIRSIVDDKKLKSGAIIGGGFIGLEMAENLQKRNIQVSLIEAQNQVMAPLDFEMAQLLHENMDQNQVSLYLNNGVSSFSNIEDQVKITLQNGDTLNVDIVILSIGVRPNRILAKECGLPINQKGGIIVDSHLHTPDPHIWAVGDVIEVDHFITKEKTMIPLAGPANKQGRMVADNIYGANKTYKGSMGTSVAKVFDLTTASTGVNEKNLQAQGLKKNQDYYSILISQKSHAGYYPEATSMFLKLLFNKDKKILGAQIVGQDGVDKRIDTIATTLSCGGNIDTLQELELAYAPPYSSAKDPVNMLGFVAENVIQGKVKFTSYNELEGKTILDVTEKSERLVYAIKGSIHVPLGELRKNLGSIPKDKEIVVYCAIGVRAYNAARILMQSGFNNVSVLEGGIHFYKSMMVTPRIGNEEKLPPKSDCGCEEIKILNCCNLQCPGPIMKVNETLQTMKEGELLKVSATDMGFARDVENWCARTGNTFLSKERDGKQNIVTIQKGNGQLTKEKTQHNGKTMIIFDGDLDKAMASFIIANGAAAMGRPVTMFFTFWGLNILRKKEKVKVKKSFIEKIFGTLMPRGVDKLKLSNMNLMGLGSKMMKHVMRTKNVETLEQLIVEAQANGVKLVACTMSMDVMGIHEKELIDGVQLAGVASYLADAEKSDVNLFI